MSRPELLILDEPTSGIDPKSPLGYLWIGLYANVYPWMLMAFGVVLGVAAIAGDEDTGGLEYLLAWPVTRSTVTLARFASMLTILASVAAASGWALAVDQLAALRSQRDRHHHRPERDGHDLPGCHRRGCLQRDVLRLRSRARAGRRWHSYSARPPAARRWRSVSRPDWASAATSFTRSPTQPGASNR